VARILVVDDEPAQRFALRRIFERAGHEVIDAGEGAAALRAVRESPPDLVVTDMMMPVMGGDEFIRRLRSEPATVGIPILAAIRPAVRALQELGMYRKVQLIISGGVRSGADVAKALALGADAVSIGTAALVALGDNDPVHEAEYQKLGTTAGAYDDWHEGRDPAVSRRRIRRWRRGSIRCWAGGRRK